MLVVYSYVLVSVFDLVFEGCIDTSLYVLCLDALGWYWLLVVRFVCNATTPVYVSYMLCKDLVSASVYLDNGFSSLDLFMILSLSSGVPLVSLWFEVSCCGGALVRCSLIYWVLFKVSLLWVPNCMFLCSSSLGCCLKLVMFSLSFLCFDYVCYSLMCSPWYLIGRIVMLYTCSDYWVLSSCVLEGCLLISVFCYSSCSLLSWSDTDSLYWIYSGASYVSWFSKVICIVGVLLSSVLFSVALLLSLLVLWFLL